MENKVCQSCGMPITSNEKIKTEASIMIIVNIAMKMESL